MQRLKNSIKNLYSFFMWYSGLLLLWLKIRARRLSAPITILNYHRINGLIFKEHLQFLTHAYNIVTIDQCYNYLKGESVSAPNSIVITFDDAYENFYYEVYPILKAFNVPAILFIPTGAIDKHEVLWFDKIRAIVQAVQADFLTVSNKTIPLTKDRYQAYTTALDYLNNQPIQKRDKAIRELMDSIPLNAESLADSIPLTWEQIREMHGLVSYGAHTETHPNLAKLDRRQAMGEILGSKVRIEEEIGCKVKYFAYPFGGISHFTGETIKILQEACFDAALTTVRGACAPGDDLFVLRRIGVDNTVKGHALVTRLSGLWVFLTT